MQIQKMKTNATTQKKQTSGITLIALTVTIVLLLILAGISINLLMGENGILEAAKEAGEQTNEAIKKEEAEYIQDFEEWIDTVVRGDTTTGEELVPASLDD